MRPFYNMPYMRTLQAEWAANAKARAEKEKAEEPKPEEEEE